MIHRKGLRFAAAALAAILTLATPVRAYSEDFLLPGTADEDTLITGTADLPQEPLFGTEGMLDEGIDPAAMFLGVSDGDESVNEALAKVVAYMKGISGNLTVGAEGGDWTAIVLARNGALTDEARNTFMQNVLAALDKN